MTKFVWFLSTVYQCDTNRGDFERTRADRHGSQGPAGACVSLLTGKTLWSLPEPKEERFRTLDEMSANTRLATHVSTAAPRATTGPAPAAATRFASAPAHPVVRILPRRSRRARLVTIWGHDLPQLTAYVHDDRRVFGVNTLTLKR